jgi:hyperosmotically inducible protein
MSAKLWVAALAAAGFVGCASNNQAPDVAGKIRDSLHNAGLTSVSVSQNREKGVVTLGGNVQQEADRARAEDVARPLTAGQVLADEIAVVPSGDNSAAVKKIDSDLDNGIQSNLDAAFIQANIKGVSHSTKNGVVTLTGEVNTPALRQQAQQVAAGVPNVQQVVNELDVKNQRATSTGADRSQQ